MPRKTAHKYDRGLDVDINRVKFLHDHTQNKSVKKAYYNLWYALVVMRHNKDSLRESEI